MKPIIKILVVLFTAVALVATQYTNVYLARQRGNFPYIRVITDLKVIDGKQGVPVDNRYQNERPKYNGNYHSVAGCPESIDGFPWVYYGNPARCHLAGQRGPCTFGQKLYIQSGSSYGKCGCECMIGKLSPFRDGELKNELRKSNYVGCKVCEQDIYEQIYETRTGNCYELYKKGICSGNKVIIGYNSTKIECGLLCEGANRWEMEAKGFCKVQTAVCAVTGSIYSDRCDNDEKYSRRLRKCVTSRQKNLFLG